MDQLQACEHSNEPLDYIHGGELCDGLSLQGCYSGMEVVNHYTSRQFLILSIQNSAFSTVNAIEHSAIITINDEYKRIWKVVVIPYECTTQSFIWNE